MTLIELTKAFQVLVEQGHGSKQVFYRHGASGDCGPVGNPHVDDHVNECGPFDLKEGEQYISLYTGN